MTMLEAQRIEQHTGRPLGRVREADQFTCPYLGVHRQCTVYEARPAICRLYGVAEGLECDFGCIPERYLTPDEVHVFFKALGELSPIMAFTFGEG
jgi:hypothetical protein